MTTVQFNIPFDAVVDAIKTLDAQQQRELFDLLNDLLFEQEEDAIEHDPAAMAEIEEARQAYRDGDYQTIQEYAASQLAQPE